VAWVASGAGDRFADVELSLEVNPPIEVTAHRSAEADVGATDPRTWAGSTAEITEAVLARRARYGVSHWVVYEDDRHRAAPIVAALAGA
jgi:hypothetical protein